MQYTGRLATTLPEAVARLLQEDPTAQRWAPGVATAESCTGGLVAKMLTDVPGSSAYFRQGYVTYSNEAKIEMLGVPPALITAHGAVSAAVAAAMAEGALSYSRAAFAVDMPPP